MRRQKDKKRRIVADVTKVLENESLASMVGDFAQGANAMHTLAKVCKRYASLRFHETSVAFRDRNSVNAFIRADLTSYG